MNKYFRKAEKLSEKFARDYDLTYLCMINLEGTISNMLQDGIPLDKIEYYLVDVLDNIEFRENYDFGLSAL